eukprot:54935_1
MGQYNSIMHCMRTMININGIQSLYKGLSVSIFGIINIPYSAANLGIYFSMKEYRMNIYRTPMCSAEILAMGTVSSVIGQFITYLIQSTRTKLQSQGQIVKLASHIIECPLYNGVFDCVRFTIQYEGIRALYRGLLPNFMQSVPSVAVSYLIFEKTKPLLSLFV